MKIWRAYGSEHSMSLVMIGHFTSVSDANKTQRLIERFSKRLSDVIDVEHAPDRYGDDILEVVREVGCYILSPTELEHFRAPKTMKLNGSQITLEITAMAASGFAKIMVEKGAKVDVFLVNNESEYEPCSRIIARFKNTDDAKKTKQLIEKFSDMMAEKPYATRERYNDAARKIMTEENCFILSPTELEHFIYDNNTQQKGAKVILTTDESEVSAFFKLLIRNGARVEIFSTHDYPYEE